VVLDPKEQYYVCEHKASWYFGTIHVETRPDTRKRRARLFAANVAPYSWRFKTLARDSTMKTQRRLISIAASGFLLLSLSAVRFEAGRAAPAACSLLTAADASKALEQTSLPGKPLTNGDPTGCIWSADPAASDSSRRVALVTVSVRAFQIAMHPALAKIKVEPVSGIGDEAFYQIYPDSPFIWVRKGDKAITIRILTGYKPKPFTNDQEKVKLVPLAKAAVAKL